VPKGSAWHLVYRQSRENRSGSDRLPRLSEAEFHGKAADL